MSRTQTDNNESYFVNIIAGFITIALLLLGYWFG